MAASRCAAHADLRKPVQGEADSSNVRFAVNARGLTWGGDKLSKKKVPAIVADADFGIAGKPEAWAAIGNARFSRDGQRADVRFDGRGQWRAGRDPVAARDDADRHA
jgi:translocation and assembly module TamB